jgi:hypothetical protein
VIQSDDTAAATSRRLSKRADHRSAGRARWWIVLQEEEALTGYLVAFHPAWRLWGLVLRSADEFTLVSVADTFINTIVGM